MKRQLQALREALYQDSFVWGLRLYTQSGMSNNTGFLRTHATRSAPASRG